jgi:hypothetical protein
MTSPHLLDAVVIWLANFLLGYPRYRVKFTYKDSGNRVVFNFTRTVTVRDRWYIEQHREIKRELGPVYNMAHMRPLLNNGTLDVDPVCYLGRWKDR